MARRASSVAHSLPRLSRRERRQRYIRLTLESLEPRILLSAFSNADLDGPLTYVAVDENGTMKFSTGSINGGTLADTNGATHTPNGSYSIQPSGAVTIFDSNTRTGAISSTHDVVVVAQNNSESTLTVVISGGSATFSDADLAGTWFFGFNGSTAESNGFGFLTFDGEGGISDGSLTAAGQDTEIDGGTYHVNSDGTCSVTINLNSQSGPTNLEYTGALNASKDFLALDPNLHDAANNHTPNLTVLVRPRGNYSNADVQGTWVLAAEGGVGTLTLDGSGHISSGTFTDTGGGVSTIGGSYSVASSGTMTINATTTGHGVTQHFRQVGAINASRNIIIENQPGASSSDNLAILVSSTSRTPTISKVAPFFTAAAGHPFTITYEQLAAHSNAIISNGQPLQFQVVAPSSGTLTLNDAPVVLPDTVGPGDTLSWTSPASATGAIAAFNVKAFDGTTLSATSATVTINTIIPEPFSNLDADGSWNLEGSDSMGNLIFNGFGTINGGFVTDDEGESDTPSGTYAITPTGAVTLVVGDTVTGAMNSSHDLMAITGHGDINVLVNSLNAGFTNSDLAGTWSMGVNGSTPGSNGIGSLTFDDSGSITAGTFKSGNGSQTLTGTYTFSPSGNINLNIITQHNSGPQTLTLTGYMNNSHDFIAVTPLDLVAAASNSDSNLIVLVHGAGKYTNADAMGTWIIASHGATGAVTLDGAGHVVNGYLNNHGVVFALTGTYSVSSSGAWTFNATITGDGQTQKQTFTGALNESRNSIIMNALSNNPDNGDNLTVLINSADHAPTLTTVTPFTTAIAGHAFPISYADLAAASNAVDFDGDAISYNVLSLAAGSSLTLNGEPVTTFPTTVHTGDNLVWTPAAGSTGNIAAFSVKVSDGILTSATAVPVTVKTVLAPTISLAVTKSNASEIKANTAGLGVFTITRANGILDQDLTVTINITGSATNGSDYTLLANEIFFPPNQKSVRVSFIPLTDPTAEGPETVVMTVVSSDQDEIYTPSSTKAAGTVTIADAANTISAATTKAAASEVNSAAGTFTFTRTGGDKTVAQNVLFTLTGTATADTDFLLANSTSVFFDAATGHGTITLAAGKTSATLTINPVDDVITEGVQTVILTPTADASYFITNNTKNTSATITIADDTRPLITGPVTVIGDAHVATPFTITFDTLLAATHTQAHAGPIEFRIVKVLKGTLQKNGINVVPNSTLLTTGQSLTYTSASTGTLSAFTVIAINGTNFSSTLTIPIHVLA